MSDPRRLTLIRTDCELEKIRLSLTFGQSEFITQPCRTLHISPPQTAN